jgi:hypothetical protein
LATCMFSLSKFALIILLVCSPFFDIAFTIADSYNIMAFEYKSDSVFGLSPLRV